VSPLAQLLWLYAVILGVIVLGLEAAK